MNGSSPSHAAELRTTASRTRYSQRTRSSGDAEAGKGGATFQVLVAAVLPSPMLHLDGSSAFGFLKSNRRSFRLGFVSAAPVVHSGEEALAPSPPMPSVFAILQVAEKARSGRAITNTTYMSIAEAVSQQQQMKLCNGGPRPGPHRRYPVPFRDFPSPKIRNDYRKLWVRVHLHPIVVVLTTTLITSSSDSRGPDNYFIFIR